VSLNSPTLKRVAVIGGGYAGMAAAVRATQGGAQVTVFEAAKVLGGRARRVDYQDVSLDNGQHILSGAYSCLLGLMRDVGVPENALYRVPLNLQLAPGFSMRAPANIPAWWPASAPLAIALFTARGISFSERLGAAWFMQKLKFKKFRVQPAQTVKNLLETGGQSLKIIRLFWEPLCVSALNTPIANACAQVFANVLRDALFGARGGSDLLLPNIDLSALFPDAAAAWLARNNGSVKTGIRISNIEVNDIDVNAITNTFKRPYSIGFLNIDKTEEHIEFDAVICAVGPHQLAQISSTSTTLNHLLATATAHFAYEPITTVYLKYPISPLPDLAAMQGQTDGLAQWFFNRDALYGNAGLVAAVISASGAHESLSQAELGDKIATEIQRFAPNLPAPIWKKVITEKRATFACTPNLDRPTPNHTSTSGFFLAGDYIACDYPGTLEAAARNGVAAADMAVSAPH
jgi:hydroxysqualene dehydroxylase